MPTNTNAAGPGGASAARGHIYAVAGEIVPQGRPRAVLLAGRTALACGLPRVALRVCELAIRWPFDGRVSLLLDSARAALEARG